MTNKQLSVYYEENWAKMYSYARRWDVPLDVAEEAVQDTFVALYKCDIPEYKVKFWIWRVLKNKLFSARRKLQKTSRDFVPVMEDLLHDDYNIIREEVLDEMYKRISTFPIQCRDVLCLYLIGLSSGGISDVMHIGIQTVRNQKTIGVKKLKEHFKKYT